jgi:hypothetical protein
MLHAARLHLTTSVASGSQAAATVPRYDLDTRVSPNLIWVAAAIMVALLSYAVRMLLTLQADGHDVVARALLPYTYANDGNAAVIRAGSIDALIQSIDDEVAEDQNQETGVPHVFEW